MGCRLVGWRRATVGLSLAFCAASVSAVEPSAAPAGGDEAVVRKCVNQLSADSPDDRDAAEVAITGLPASDEPLLEAAAQRPDLSPGAAVRLHRLLAVIRPRVKLWRRHEADSGAMAEWWRTQSLADYDRDGHANPKWDAAVRSSLLANCRRLGATGDAWHAAADEANRQAKVAVAAGCDDPTFLTLYALLTLDTGGTPEAAQRLFEQADEASRNGKINPYFKTIIDGRVLRARTAKRAARKLPALDRTAVREVNEMAGLCNRAVSLPGMPVSIACDTVDNVLSTGQALGLDPKRVFDNVFAPLQAAFPNDARVLVIKGNFYVDYAWDARGGGWANTVTPQGWADMADRLNTARDALLLAWQRNPGSAAAPQTMLKVELGQDNGRPAMEKWFDRAMAADPDCFAACTAKLYYLEPKWHGSPEEMLAFGHELLDAGNWTARLPIVLVDAHVALSQYATDPAAYFVNDVVWSDIYTVYTGYLRRYPGDDGVRAYYTLYAWKCHQWKAADEQFKRLGDKVDASVFGGVDLLNAARSQSAERAADPAQQGR